MAEPQTPAGTGTGVGVGVAVGVGEGAALPPERVAEQFTGVVPDGPSQRHWYVPPAGGVLTTATCVPESQASACGG